MCDFEDQCCVVIELIDVGCVLCEWVVKVFEVLVCKILLELDEIGVMCNVLCKLFDVLVMVDDCE